LGNENEVEQRPDYQGLNEYIFDRLSP